jgi:Protein of unknown function (DUF1203)
MSYQISIPREAFLHQVRSTDRDDQGQPVRRFRAEGGEPIRDRLRRAQAGEALILGSYGPFAQPGPFRELGPVYVAAEPSGEPLPTTLTALVDRGYFTQPFVLRKYDASGDLVKAEVVALGDAETRLRVYLSGAAFVDARFTAFGCWAARFSPT